VASAPGMIRYAQRITGPAAARPLFTTLIWHHVEDDTALPRRDLCAQGALPSTNTVVRATSAACLPNW
jgi:hypothetical protein